MVDDAPVRSTRPLSDIYERCNIVVCEHVDFRAKILYETTLYVKHYGNDILIVSLYINGLLLIENNTSLVQKFKTEIMKVFEITDLELVSFFLKMKIK